MKKIVFLVVLSAIGFSFLAAPAQAELQVQVDARPENAVRLPDLYFDRGSPPRPMEGNEAAFTEATVSCQTNSNAQASVKNGKKNKPCTADITVEEVSVTVKNLIRVNLPAWPTGGSDWDKKSWKILQAHEEGHVTIYGEVFALVGQEIAEKVFGKCPSSFNISVPFCNDAEIQVQMNKELDVVLDALTAEAVAKISAACRKVGEEYDSVTSHGRQGPRGEPSTIENQAQAAKEAILRFKQQAGY